MKGTKKNFFIKIDPFYLSNKIKKENYNIKLKK